MNNLVKIGERIINLATIAFVERTIEDGTDVVTIFYHPQKQWWEEVDQPKHTGTREDPIIHPLNMRLKGADARYIWSKLTGIADMWALPGEIEPEQS